HLHQRAGSSELSSRYVRCPSPYHDLHPFPTRRSSDLRYSPWVPRPSDRPRRLKAMSYKRIVLATDGSPSAETAEHVGVTLTRSVDRKSTRLNSSHDQISYAVFCLKKQNRYA